MEQAGAARRARTPDALRRSIGRRLLRVPGPLRGSRKALAQELEVTTRTLSNWAREARAGVEPARVGRPPHGEKAWANARRRVGEEWVRQGRGAGVPRIAAALAALPEEDRVPLRLMRAVVSQLKRLERAVEREAWFLERTTHEVRCRDAIWGADGLDVGRDEAGKVEALLLQDPGPGRTLCCRVDGPVTSAWLVAQVRESARARGGFPLVLQVDRGGANRGEDVAALARAERMILLYSRPRTPTDNPRTERAIRDVREVSGVTEGGRGVDRAGAQAAINDALVTCNGRRRQARHGHRTAIEMDALLARADRVVDREAFHGEARAAMEAARAAAVDARAARKAEREALFAVMEHHGLVRVHRPVPREARSRTDTARPLPARSPADAPWRPTRPRPPAPTPTASKETCVAIGASLRELLEQLAPRGRPAPTPCSAAGTPRNPSPGECARTQNALCCP